MASKTWNVGIVGYGFSAKIFHIPFVQDIPQFKLYAVVQRTPKPDDDAEKDHPGIKSYRSAEDLVQDAGVDVVVITTAPDSHHYLAKLALENGKHGESSYNPMSILCHFLSMRQRLSTFRTNWLQSSARNRLPQPTKKPLSSSISPRSRTSSSPYTRVRNHRFYRPRDRPLTKADRRWDADFVTLSKLVKTGQLGRVVEFETHFDRHRPEEPAPTVSKWKNKVVPGGSAIHDLGSHLLDQALYLLGKPERVTGFVGSQREVNTSGFQDSFTVLLHYKSGTLVTAKAGVVSPEEEQLRFWVRGDKGSFKKVSHFSSLYPVIDHVMLTGAVPPRLSRGSTQGWYEAGR